MKAARGSASDENLAAGIRKIVKDINLADKKLVGIDAGIKSITCNIESVLNLSKKVASLSYVQIALSVANMAVDIAGFTIIASKLKGLGEQLNQIAKQLSELKDISVEDMRESCETLCLNYNSIVTKIHDGDALERDELESYLIQSKTFLSKLNRLLLKKTVDAEIILNMIFMLLPAYTSILCIFLRAYYFEKKATPLNYENFLEIYEEINDPAFREAVQDYYLLDKNFDYCDVIDILNVQLSTVFGERLEIDDQLELISVFSTDEEYLAFEKQLEASAEKEVMNRAEEIASHCGEHADECRRILAATA